MASRVLFPGRFQPFHKGHLWALERLLREFDEVVIAIGSAQEGFTCRNPFTAGERAEMIAGLLKELGVRDRAWLIPVPDLNMPMAWASHVLGLVPRVKAVASGNQHVLLLYKWLGVETLELELLEPEKFNGTFIRQLMLNGDRTWADLVPGPIAEYILAIDGVNRVKRVCRVEGANRN